MFRGRGEPLLFRGYRLGFTPMRLGANGQRGMDSVRKNANEVYDGKYFRNGVNLFREAILRNISNIIL